MNRRNSLQKKVIGEALAGMDHPSAAEVYEYIHSAHPQISLGTVYRNLGTLANDGAALRLSFTGSADRFDPNTYEHYHAVCKNCSKIFDVQASVEPELIHKLDKAVEQSCGVKVKQHNLIFEGTCPRCQ